MLDLSSEYYLPIQARNESVLKSKKNKSDAARVLFIKKFMGFECLKRARWFIHTYTLHTYLVQSEFSRMRCSAASSSFRHLLVSLRPFSSCLRHPPRLSFPSIFPFIHIKLRGLSPRANYTDRAAAACRRS